MTCVSATQRFGGRKWTAGITKHFRNAFQGPSPPFLTRYFLKPGNSPKRSLLDPTVEQSRPAPCQEMLSTSLKRAAKAGTKGLQDKGNYRERAVRTFAQRPDQCCAHGYFRGGEGGISRCDISPHQSDLLLSINAGCFRISPVRSSFFSRQRARHEQVDDLVRTCSTAGEQRCQRNHWRRPARLAVSG